jgi:hypothetical protein
MTLAIYKQLQRDGTKLHVEWRESIKQTMLIRRLSDAPSTVRSRPVMSRQRDKVKKKNKQLARQKIRPTKSGTRGEAPRYLGSHSAQ